MRKSCIVDTYDLIVVGLGINGSGIARDAAMRGLGVLALDQSDVGAETTSWNSRLVHGAHHFDQGEMGLARALVIERERLLDIAPHLVRPRPLILPIMHGAARSPLKIRLNLLAHDLLSIRKSLAHHRMLTPEEAIRIVPGLERKTLHGAALYWDCEIFYPERLALENALSARSAGAEIRTHTRVERLIQEGDRVIGVAYRDLIDGDGGEARAQVVINAGGPWTDRVLETLGRPQPRRISGMKGSHIIVDQFSGGPQGHILVIETRPDRRPLFIIPWNGRLLIGATEKPFDGDPAEAAAEESEVEQLLDDVNRAIPSAGLTRSSILYSYSGVRPVLNAGAGVQPAMSNHFIILDHAPRPEGLLSVVGGKLAIHRELAEQAVDLVFGKMGRRPPRCRTHQTPLPGAEGDLIRFGWGFIMRSGLDEPVARRLARIYGTRARLLEELWRTATELKEPLDPCSLVLRAEVVLAGRDEMARTLNDMLMRRILAGLDPDLGRSAAVPAASIAAQYLDWSEARAKAELARHERLIERLRVPGSQRAGRQEAS